METSAPLVGAVEDSARFHCNSHQSDAASHHSNSALLSDLVAPDFVINWIEIRDVW